MNILTLKKLAASLHIVLMQLVSKRSPFVSDEARASFSEMIQNAIAIRACDRFFARSYWTELVGSVQAEAASRTSEIARVLDCHFRNHFAVYIDCRNLRNEFSKHAGTEITARVILWFYVIMAVVAIVLVAYVSGVLVGSAPANPKEIKNHILQSSAEMSS